AAVGRRSAAAGEHGPVAKSRMLACLSEGLDEVLGLLRKDITARLEVLVDPAEAALLVLEALEESAEVDAMRKDRGPTEIPRGRHDAAHRKAARGMQIVVVRPRRDRRRHQLLGRRILVDALPASVVQQARGLLSYVVLPAFAFERERRADRK